jgi:hypothetical protein
MPKAWLCIPSAREYHESTVRLWSAQGYGVALFRDAGSPDVTCELLQVGKYEGYAKAVNGLVLTVLEMDQECEWTIAAGDDVEPELNYTASHLAEQLTAHFGGTLGVCQFTADRWGDTPRSRAQFGENRGAYIDRVCGSAWIGREFARRVNQGNGPLWPEYKHQFVDEELQEVATRLGVFWQRPDLIQLHRHWGRGPDEAPNMPGDRNKMPDFLTEANSTEHWAKYKKLFDTRKAAGFPGSELLP